MIEDCECWYATVLALCIHTFKRTVYWDRVTLRKETAILARCRYTRSVLAMLIQTDINISICPCTPEEQATRFSPNSRSARHIDSSRIEVVAHLTWGISSGLAAVENSTSSNTTSRLFQSLIRWVHSTSSASFYSLMTARLNFSGDIALAPAGNCQVAHARR